MATTKPRLKKRRVRPARWWVYFVCCADRSLYCGIAADVPRRVAEHNSSPKSAKYTRSRRPVELVWSEPQKSRSAALKREYALKRLTRTAKTRLIARHTSAR